MTGSQNSDRKIQISKKLLLVNSASSVLAKLFNMFFIVWAYQYLLNRISAEEFAILPVVMVLITFAPLFFAIFIGGIARYVVEAYTKADFDQITIIVSSIFLPMAVMATVFFSGGVIFALNIDHVFNVAPEMRDDAQVMMALLVVSFGLQMLGTPFSVGFHVLQRYVELNLLGVARDLLRITLLVTLLIWAGPHVIWVVVATAVAETLHTAAIFWRSRQMVPELSFRLGAFESRRMRELMSFGIWTTLGRLGNLMYTNAATLLLNLYGTAVDVTVYHIGATFFRQLEGTVQLAIQPAQTALTSMHADGNQDRFANLVFRGGRYALWAALIVAVPMLVFADDFIALYLEQEQYARAALAIVLFMLILPFTYPTAMLAMAAMAKAEVRSFFLPAFLFQLAGLVLMVLVVTLTDLGAVGMVLSLLLITALSQVTYYWRFCLKLTKRTLAQFWRQVLRPGLTPALATLGFCLGLDAVIGQNSWLSLILSGMASALVYLGILLGFCLSVDERQDVWGLVRRIWP